MNRKLSRLAGLIALGLASTAQAATLSWNNSQSFWELSSAWSPIATPGAGDIARFNLNAVGKVVWRDATGNRSVLQLRIQDGSYTFDNPSANAHALTLLSNAADAFWVGGANTATFLNGLRLDVSAGGAQIANGAALQLGRGSGGVAGRLTVAQTLKNDGQLNLLDGGSASSTEGVLGSSAGTTGTATVSGKGSQWSNSAPFSVGLSGTGVLNVQDGGLLSNTLGFVGRDAGANGTAKVTGPGSQWNSSSYLAVGESGSGTLLVQDGGRVTNTIGYLGINPGASGAATVTGAGSQWNSSSDLTLGHWGSGALTVESGGLVTSRAGNIGAQLGSIGTARVAGSGAQWINSGGLVVGNVGVATLEVLNGGKVSNAAAYIGSHPYGNGTVTVSGAGSTWLSSAELNIGGYGTGALQVLQGGLVSSTDGFIARMLGANGTATVGGPSSQWILSGNLYVGGSSTASGGTGTLNIDSGGLVKVGGISRLWAGSGINLKGGRFEFGEMSMAEFNAINAVSGSLAGILRHGGYTDIATMSGQQNSGADLSAVKLVNTGVLYGQVTLGVALVNSAGGEVETLSGEDRMRFAGAGNSNAGEINNGGGVIRFDRDLTNQAGGLVAGRGKFVANGGWTNHGVMAFSGGPADIHGDLSLVGEGRVVSSGGATTTFYDDVVHNGAEIATAAGSNTVFFGAISGAGPFTGAGTVFFHGDLRPGNSPALLGFGGSLVLGSQGSTQMELAGAARGTQHDALDVADTLTLSGILDVVLAGGYRPAPGAYFDLFTAEHIGGTFAGQVLPSLAPGQAWSLVQLTDFRGSTDVLRLSVTAVPEPAPAWLLGGGLLCLMAVARRRMSTSA